MPSLMGIELWTRDFTGIRGVRQSEVYDLWPVVAPYLALAIERFAEGHTLDDTLDKLLRQERQLWLGATAGALDGVAVTKVVMLPRAKLCEIFLAAGRMETLAHIGEIESWAHEIGCDRVVAYCRPGIARGLKGEGYKLTSQLVEKRLCPPNPISTAPSDKVPAATDRRPGRSETDDASIRSRPAACPRASTP